MVRPKISALVITEDSSKDSFRIMSNLIAHMLKFAFSLHNNPDVKFIPLTDPLASQGAYGQRWRNKKNPEHFPKRIALLRTIATTLASGDENFIFVHWDADDIWKHKKRGKVSIVENDFIAFLNDLSKVVNVRASTSTNVPQALQRAAAGQIITIIPYYSIESWLYQNTSIAIAICKQKYRGRDVQKFTHWQEHREELDEVSKPKTKTCLHSKHNLELATSFPVRHVFDVRKSFHAAIEHLRLYRSLERALQK